MNYVSSLLIDNGIQQMHKEGKLYAMSINDRLLFIESKLKNIASKLSAESTSITHLKKDVDDDYTLLALLPADGKIVYIDAENKQLPIIPKIESNTHKTQLFSSEHSPAIYMVVFFNFDENKHSSRLIAKIDPMFLWGKRESLPFDKNICVLEKNNKILFCSDPVTVNILKDVNIKVDAASSVPLEWIHEREKYLAINWEFYLKSRFDTVNWNILTSQQEKEMLQPIQFFNKIYALVIVLTLLIVSAMSLSLIRKSLVPLERLLEGTRRVSKREFSVPVEVHSNDEFEELADSFNEMTNQLSLQFDSLSTLSKIDQLILLDPTDEIIKTTVLDRIKEISPTGIISITIFEHETLEIGYAYFSDYEHPFSKRLDVTSFLSEEVEKFIAENESSYLHLMNESEAILTPFNNNANSVYIFPVKVKEHLAALIYLGYEDNSELDDDGLNQIKELANRLAVALTSADKDKKLYLQSHFDSLTQLPNRQLFNDRLEQEIIHAKRQNKVIAVLFIDLDRFKNINDTLGHYVGDKLLQLTANRLKSNVRETDTVARLGGDEFTLILSNINEAKDAGIFAKNIVSILSEPFYIETNEIFINASIGIAVYPFDGEDKIELVKNADTAMYRVKSGGRGFYMYYEEKMNHEDVERANLERDLYHALENNEFELYYQPLVNLKTSKIIGAETLLRWNHPGRGIVPCLSFIPLAEESGLIESIGEWVIRTACNQYQAWKKQGMQLDFIAVNISNRQFLQHDFLDIISTAIESAEMQANCLELEITEGILVDSRIDTLDIFNKLNAMGVSLSIDDFGTGYSSFSYLKRFPISTLKIDRSFLNDVPRDENANSIVSSIIALAHTLNIKVVAEGIESKEQEVLLRERQCNYGQGYYFNPPLPAQVFMDYIIKNNS